MKKSCTNRVRMLALVAGSCALSAAPAAADVHNYAGAIFAGVETSPPSNYDLRLNATEDNTRTRVFMEHYRILLASNVYYNATGVGTYQQNSSLVHRVIPDGNSATVNSYIFHFDPTSGWGNRRVQGWVEFTSPIYVISKNADLDAADVHFGMPGVQYATGPASDRGYDLAANDAFWISQPQAGIWRLTFDATATTGMDELRVIEVVHIPPPPPPPCDGDWNNDGILDFFDVVSFLNDFSAGVADLNTDGMSDFFDLQIYLGLFAQGCP